MTESEARTILLRAAEAGAFDAVSLAWHRCHSMPGDLLAALDACGEDNWATREVVWDDYLTRWANRIATDILGEPFELPSWKAGWQAVSRDREDPFWTIVMDRMDGQ